MRVQRAWSGTKRVGGTNRDDYPGSSHREQIRREAGGTSRCTYHLPIQQHEERGGAFSFTCSSSVVRLAAPRRVKRT